MSLNGVLLICDQVYPTHSQKVVIAGVYDAYATHEVPVRIRNLQLFLRFQVPLTKGQINIRIWAEDDKPTSFDQPGSGAFVEWQVIMPEPPPHIRTVQYAHTVPCFALQPATDLSKLDPGVGVEMPLSLGFAVNGEFVARAPLLIRLEPPFTYVTESPSNPHRPQPPDGRGLDQ